MTDAPKITPADIEAAIAWEATFNGGHAILALSQMGAAARGAYMTTPYGPNPPARVNDVTVCVLVTHSGFVVVGTSCPVMTENFDRELGEKAARDNALNQLWPLMGYALRERIHAGNAEPAAEVVFATHPPHVSRMVTEYSQLVERLSALTAAITPGEGSIAAQLPEEEQMLLAVQHKSMLEYAEALAARIGRAGYHVSAHITMLRIAQQWQKEGL